MTVADVEMRNLAEKLIELCGEFAVPVIALKVDDVRRKRDLDGIALWSALKSMSLVIDQGGTVTHHQGKQAEAERGRVMRESPVFKT